MEEPARDRMTEPFFTYRADVDRVIDGDTIDFRIDCGFGFVRQTRLRLLGIDTHEIYGVDDESEEYLKGRAEAAFVSDWVTEAKDGFDGKWPFIVETVRDETGKYGRYLGSVFRRDTGKNLGMVLKKNFNDISS